MMYMGSKTKIAKHIIPILQELRGQRPWVEPFMGGGNSIDKVDGVRIGNDINKNVVSLLEACSKGWIPPTEVSREFYYEVKKNKHNYAPHLVGFVSFLCSFGGKEWGGYAFNSNGTNYAATASRCLVKQGEKLKGVQFIVGTYQELKLPQNSFIYCDPPYANTTKYTNNFDSQKFYQWCRDTKEEGHVIAISEYSCPQDFKEILSIETNTFMNKNKQDKRTEKLFIV